MHELFKTVLILSLFGFLITAVLLLIKPLTARKFPAKWQYWVWILVLVSMIFPAYKLIPKQQAERLPVLVQAPAITQPGVIGGVDAPTEITILTEIPILEQEIPVSKSHSIPLFDLLSYIWLGGFFLYLAVIVTSYGVYCIRKQKHSQPEERTVLDEAKNRMGIRRKLSLRKMNDDSSPMLVGLLRPTVYLPNRNLSQNQIRMVFLHELTHYKRGDLFLKWLALFVNAVHWFNPLCYLLVANFSEACEVSCDMAVTRHMSDEEQKLYMKTILELVEEKEENHA